MEPYPYLVSHGIDKSVCETLFVGNSTNTFCLQEKPVCRPLKISNKPS